MGSRQAWQQELRLRREKMNASAFDQSKAAYHIADLKGIKQVLL